MKEWTPLANKGHAEAQNRLASMYEDGEGVSQDANQAMARYRKAADQVDGSAQENMGTIYEQGQEISKPENFLKASDKYLKQGS